MKKFEEKESSVTPSLFEPSLVKSQFNINDSELITLNWFGSEHYNDVENFIEDFYQWMEKLPEFKVFFTNPVTINHVKKQQIKYWHEFFKGEITAEYLKNRVHIGAVHAEIGLPIYSYSSAMNFSSEWWKNKIESIRKRKEIFLENKDVNEVIVELSNVFNKLVQLDISIVTQTYHQNTQQKLKKTLEETQQIVHDISSITDAVSKGDYTKKLVGDSNLNSALNQMIDALNTAAQESKRDTWLKTGQAQLLEKLRGDQDLVALCANAIEFFAKYLSAKVGVFYFLENKEKLILMASYAYQHRKKLSNEFKIGQGLLGQSVLERQGMIVDNLPKNYLSISSGLGEAKSASVLVYPILLEGSVIAVMEFGTFEKFDELHLEFLKLTNDAMASILESAKNREKMSLLLEDLKTKTQEMEVQSKKLSETNRNLEEQTRVIKESEEELKLQSEELQATNEELEEKTRDLEAKKRDIERQNENLERSQKLLQEKTEELQKSSKYKSEFLSNMSHELRTPLNSLLILSQSFMENSDGNLTADQVETAKIIHDSGEDLLNLINDILDLSKVEAGKLHVELSQFNPRELVEGLCAKLKPVAEKLHVALDIKVDEGVPSAILSDTMRVEQILKNLLSNAIKFSKQGGSVYLKVHLPREKITFKREDLAGDKVIAFSVVDHGIGVAEKDKNLIFEAFQQVDGSTSRKYTGTGLGLTISRQLSELLGGEIQLESKPGFGSIFTLFLPIERGAVGGIKTQHLKEKSRFVKSTSPVEPLVLIIEDDKNFNNILGDHLRNRKIDFINATTGAEGLDKIHKFNPTAIILDIGLPDMNGLDLLDQLTRDSQTKHIPVHVVSASNVKEKSLEKGALGFIRKPLDKKMISDLLDNASKVIQEPVQNVLIVEDNAVQRKEIANLIKSDNINVLTAEMGEEAKKILLSNRVHCMILDLTLPDMTGKELLEYINKNKKIMLPAVIIYTARDITEEEEIALNEYTPSIVLKCADSPKRLIDEVNLFLNNMYKKTDYIDVVMPVVSGQDIAGKKVLLVDDDMRNNIALGAYLRKKGLQIVTADNGEFAIERLAEDAGIDLVLMDIMMPVMDGYEAITRIRSRDKYQKLPIIALTAKAMPEDREKCIKVGANDYLTKPIDMEKLFSVMRVWLNK